MARDLNQFSELDLEHFLFGGKEYVNTILQQPLPNNIEDFIEKKYGGLEKLSQDLDVGYSDALGIPAVSEAAFRLIKGRYISGMKVGLIGSKGYFGAVLSKLMNQENINYVGYDVGDSLSDLSSIDIIVSCTGSPGILNEKNLKPHHIVIDVGFSPIDNNLKRYSGDVHKSAEHIPLEITPVPGGIGPLQISILMERFVRKNIDPFFPRWSLSQSNGDKIRFERISTESQDPLSLKNNELTHR